MNDLFYKAFEDQFRGSRALIKGRLRAYQPFIQYLINLDSDAHALDLGCGRGEWLELLAEYKFKAKGIDLDEGMLSDCRKLGLDVEHGNALKKLSNQASESLLLISGFHIAEHLSNADLQILIREAHRALKPGGLLILETPNTENITVATINFYFDPSHLRPIPAKLLQFLTQYFGFTKSKIIRLQESTEVRDSKKAPSLFQVLNEASPDYAVVAQKLAAPDQSELFDVAFNQEYGLSLDELSARYDAGIQLQIDNIQSQVNDLQRLLKPVLLIRKLKNKLLTWLR
jgi:O-antigen chain-terminating methyltransferase